MNPYPWIKWFHILAVLIFFFTHGVSMAAAFNLAKEKNPDRLRAILDVSRWSIMPMNISIMLVLVFGVILIFIAGWSTHFWPWLALVLLFVMAGWMTSYSRATYSPIRKALGQPYMTGASKLNPPTEPASMDQVYVLIARSNPRLNTYIGLLFTVLILLLMVFKPF